MFKKLALPALALFALQAEPAHAALITFNLTVDANAIVDAGTFPITTLNGGTLGTRRLQLGFNQGGLVSGVINQGDVVETNVTIINGGLTLDSGPQGGSDELLVQTFGVPGFNINTENPLQEPLLEITRTHELIVQSHTGALNTLAAYTDTFTNISPQFSNAYEGNITDSMVTLTSFTLRTTYDAITFLSPFDQQLSLPVEITGSTIFALDQRVVPAPGALALLGFGLLGLAVRRRTA